jgi:hypothetical protein
MYSEPEENSFDEHISGGDINLKMIKRTPPLFQISIEVI